MKILNNIEPMKCRGFKNTIEEQDKIEAFYDNKDYAAQEKMDGCRYLLQLTKTGARLFSRVASKKGTGNVEKTDNIPHITGVALKGYEDTIIDGEIMSPNPDKVAVTSIMGALPDKALERQAEFGNVRYNVFDILYYKGEDVQNKTLLERKELLDEVVEAYNKAGVKEIFSLPLFMGTGDQKREYYKTIIARGGEGIILKDINSKYEQGERPKTWVKVKKMITSDVVCMSTVPAEKWYAKPGEKGHDGVLYPNGKTTRLYDNGWIGAVKYGKYKNGVLTEIGECSGFTDEERERITKSPKRYIGKVFELVAQFRFVKDGVKGGYRHASFIKWRDDKKPIECTDDTE
jgi:DNA ligase-1